MASVSDKVHLESRILDIGMPRGASVIPTTATKDSKAVVVPTLQRLHSKMTGAKAFHVQKVRYVLQWNSLCMSWSSTNFVMVLLFVKIIPLMPNQFN